MERMRVARAAGLGLLLVLAFPACKRKSEGESSSGEEASGRPVLVDEREERSILERLDAESLENRRRKCPRPLLRGEPLGGAADEDMIAVGSGDGPLAGCYQAVEELDEGPLGEWLDAAPELAEAPPAPIRALEATCAPLADRLSRAVSHRDACSPFLPGRRGQPDLSVLEAAKAAIVLARARARAGDARAAGELLLDMIRFSHDLSRGGSSLLEPMLATAALWKMLPHLSAIVDAKALTDEAREALEDQLGRLLETQVPASSLHRGEALAVALYTLRPSLEEPGWTPTGGFPAGMEPRGEDEGPGERLGMADFGHSKRQGVLLTLVALQKTRARWVEACPDGGTWKSCIDGMQEVVGELAQKAADSGAEIHELLARPAELREQNVRSVVRREIIAILQNMYAGTHVKYFRRLAWQEAALLALRAKVRARLGSCPGEPPAGRLGAPLELVTTDPGLHLLKAPSFAAYRATGEGGEEVAFRELVRLRCP